MVSLSLAETWETYRRMHSAHLAPQTRRAYLSAMNHAVAELPARPTAADVQRWHRQTLPSRFSVPYSNLCLAVLQAVVRRTAVVNGDAELAAAVLTALPLRKPILAPRCPPLDAYTRALGAARNPAEVAWLGLCFTAGLRKGELLGLLPGDWSPTSWVLRVTRQRESEHRKNRRPHSVRVQCPRLAAAIAWTIEHHAELVSRQGWHRGRSAPYLFPWAEKRVDGILSRVRAVFGSEVGLYLPRGLAWHAGRHWGSSVLAARGASLFDIQRWLGDASADVAEGYINTVRGETSAIPIDMPRTPLCEFGEIAPARRAIGGQVLNPCLSSTLPNASAVLEWHNAGGQVHEHGPQTQYLVTGRGKR